MKSNKFFTPWEEKHVFFFVFLNLGLHHPRRINVTALNASYISRPTKTLKIGNLCFDLQILGTGNWLKSDVRSAWGLNSLKAGELAFVLRWVYSSQNFQVPNYLYYILTFIVIVNSLTQQILF